MDKETQLEKLKTVAKRVENSFVFLKPVTEIHIPLEYLDMSKRLASIESNKVTLFGVFHIFYWDSLEDHEEGKKPHTILMKLSSEFTSIPSHKELSGQKYIFRYFPMDIFIEQVFLVQTIENQKKMINMIFNRYVPDSVGYSDIYQLWETCKRVNNTNLKSPSSLLELIVSEICRNPDNWNENFRMYIKKNPNYSEYDRVLVNLLDLPKYLSTFGSISSANPIHGATKAITRTEKGEKEVISPVEEAIR